MFLPLATVMVFVTLESDTLGATIAKCVLPDRAPHTNSDAQ